jgi:hypothetical protein
MHRKAIGYKSSSTCAQAPVFFFHPRLVISFSFPAPPIKLKLGLQTGLKILLATRLDQSNYLANQQQVLGSAMPCISLSIPWQDTRLKLFLQSHWHFIDFSSSYFLLLGHILITSGAALTTSWDSISISIEFASILLLSVGAFDSIKFFIWAQDIWWRVLSSDPTKFDLQFK